MTIALAAGTLVQATHTPGDVMPLSQMQAFHPDKY
jgi:hypothetical protein